MKKYFYISIVCTIILVISIFVGRENRIISMDPDKIVSVEIYNATTYNDEVQMMHIINPQEAAEVLDNVRRIKPNDNAIPLDGNYTIIFHQRDGDTLLFEHEDGIVNTTAGFQGRVENDNMFNKLWAKLDYPVQHVIRKEFDSLSR